MLAVLSLKLCEWGRKNALPRRSVLSTPRPPPVFPSQTPPCWRPWPPRPTTMMRTPTLLRVLRSPSRRLLCPRTGALVDSRGLCAPARRTAPAATAPAEAFTDINVGTWVNRWLPAAAVPFAQLGRWDRPIGTWLLLWPCMWSTALAAPPGLPPDLALCAAFGAGAFVMRGAGCTINDLWDRDFDRQVERTRLRPLASGAVSVPAAIGFVGAQLTCGLCVLLTLPPAAVVLGLASTPLWVLYPLAKRVTNWPQATPNPNPNPNPNPQTRRLLLTLTLTLILIGGMQPEKWLI